MIVMQQQQNLDFSVLLNGRVVYYTTSPYQAVCEEASVPHRVDNQRTLGNF